MRSVFAGVRLKNPGNNNMQNYFEEVYKILDLPTKAYFKGHRDRFEYQYNLFSTFFNGKKLNVVYDIGTFFPFSSLYFAEQGAEVYYGCEKLPNVCGIPNTQPFKIDLTNPPQLPQADLVLCCECLEHLTCNLYPVRDYLASLVKPGGYLFLSFPTGGIMLGRYDETLPNEGDKHYREFPVEKAREFYRALNFNLIAEHAVKTPLYQSGEGILHVLLQKGQA